jgi:hypothetical protein
MYHPFSSTSFWSLFYSKPTKSITDWTQNPVYAEDEVNAYIDAQRFSVASQFVNVWGIIPMNAINEMFKTGPTDVERWTEGLHAGFKRWKGVEQKRQGVGDVFYSRGKLFAEMNYTMREIRVKFKLGKTQQQRAIALGSANATREGMAFKSGWVNVTVDSEERLQNALTLARQAYMETQR